MGGATPKQYTQLGHQSMLEHAVEAVLADPRVGSALVVVAPDDQHWKACRFEERVRVAAVGGSCRAQSVRSGLAQLEAAAHDWVLVHDAARPCLAPAELSGLIDALLDDAQGGLLALPLADTLKREQGGRVVATVERSGLWRALTPQMFRVGLLERALAAAPDLGAVTDEATAVEQMGLQPRLVAGRGTNLKVTTVADWPLAEAILRSQGRWK